MRVGIGYDVHRLVRGRPLILGGIPIPFKRGLAGHSDADVLLHAMIDALLGAAGLGSIGQHFPPSDPRFRGVSSLWLLEQTRGLLTQRGWRVVNLDSTILAEAPLLAPYLPRMKVQIATHLQVPLEALNLKATTGERLGFIGRGQGIAAAAVALIAPRARR
ncbi:MAG: 2-C-methyl-D-erythritol 2,4-cyclodiphosphate synthase [Elusimicrobia bacterium]|nr:2-C-methyl-D-erythritol 2,4-cyclodiphosphate synthase [Elusimicrobiota bacterium]